MIVMGTRSGK
uniref:Uncharacterized protein n=1 Tax=Zea mays TaxID=4577 RepID=C4J3A2_MAIZE|nr:unknown [Zea mays]